ncbi:MAG TPA: hypothetical protein VLS89_04475 [Candidatus Nanopelagicales bacterium]|nr:hypothetical protein [Candidatus Nanopelagicales bacterium]
MASVPKRIRWVFWDVDASTLDPRRDADFILPRILEFGGMEEVRWAMKTYGLEGIHRFLRDVGHPELSPRTLRFWRVALKVGDEPWANPSAWRQHSGAPWID